MNHVLPIPQASDLAHTIQLSVAPVFLLAGIAGFLGAMTSRLGRVVDRSRQLEAQFTHVGHPDHDRQVWELRILDERMRLANTSIFLCTSSAVMVCLIIVGLFLSQLIHLGFGRTMAVGFIIAMALLILGLFLFLAEIRIALRSVRVREELLERREARERREQQQNRQ